MRYFAAAMCFAAVFFSASVQALGAQPLFEPAPGWVDPQRFSTLPEEQASQVQDGVYYALLDRQVKVSADSYELYAHLAREIVNRSGLEEGARLEFSFDPTEEDFIIHAVRLVRGGETIEPLDQDAFQVFRRETELAQGITDGNLTVYAEIPDVRVGDIIEYEIGWRTRSSLWPGEFFRIFGVEWSVPVGRAYERVILPAGRKLTVRNRKTDIEPEISRSGEGTEYVWDIVAPPLTMSENAAPSSFPLWGSVAVSTLDAWSDVTESLDAHYNTDEAFSDEFLKDQPWIDGTGDIRDRVTKAVRFVQDEIRYVADETGVGSHVPRAPMTVVDRGWGDCKDKSRLLAALLRRMGVEAYVALTDIGEGHALPDVAASPFVFDHAIVVAVYHGERYWIDATLSLQGGVFPNIGAPNYGYGLPLFEGSDELWPIAVKTPETPTKVIVEKYDFSELAEKGVLLEVKSRYVGGEADSFRRQVEATSPTKLSSDYLAYYRKLYTGLQSAAEMRITDERDSNVITTLEEYFLPEDAFKADGLWSSFPFQSDAVRNVLTEVVSDGRKAPVALPFPTNNKHIITISGTSFEVDGVENFNRSLPEIAFNRKSSKGTAGLSIVYSLSTKAPVLPLERLSEYQRIVDEITEYGYLEYNLNESELSAFSAVDAQATFFLIVAIMWGLSIVLALWAAFKTLAADNETMNSGVFHPVSISKFAFLTVLTLGAYAIFWMFRCWRWSRRVDGEQISPFWRAFFSWICFYMLFSSIRMKAEDEGWAPARALGVVLAVLYGVSYIVFSILSSLSELTSFADLAMSTVDGLCFLLIAPLVVWVNRLNVDRPELTAAHSAWSWRTFAAAFYGVSLWGLLFFAAFTPE